MSKLQIILLVAFPQTLLKGNYVHPGEYASSGQLINWEQFIGGLCIMFYVALGCFMQLQRMRENAQFLRFYVFLFTLRHPLLLLFEILYEIRGATKPK